MIIYNRFYRTLLLSGLNYFFKKYNKIMINNIYTIRGRNHRMSYFHGIQFIKFNFQLIG